MSDLIPEPILQRIQEFATARKTGSIALNFFEGRLMNADANEHITLSKQKTLDKPTKVCKVAQ